MGPVTIAKIEKGEMSIAKAIEIKRVFDANMKGKVHGYVGVERYRSDGLLSEQDITDMSLSEKLLFNNSIIQFLISSRQLTMTQLLTFEPHHFYGLNNPFIPECLKNGKLTVALFLEFKKQHFAYLETPFVQDLFKDGKLTAELFLKFEDRHFVHLEESFIQDWFKNGKLTAALFLKCTLDQLYELAQYPLQDFISQNKLTAEDVLDFLTQGLNRFALIKKIERGYTAKQAVLLLSFEKNRKII